MVARRGDALREHILQAAKQVFLEMGFERTAMDEVAKRANTSKRSLYAHFESKEKLFLEVIELVRGLFLGRLKEPTGADPVEALTMFCARYLESILYAPAVQLMRMTLAETRRFPEASAQHYDVVFTEVTKRLTAYFKATFGATPKASHEAAQHLLAQLLFPRLPRALFGLEELVTSFDDRALSPKVDLRAVRRCVTEVVETLRAATR